MTENKAHWTENGWRRDTIHTKQRRLWGYDYYGRKYYHIVLAVVDDRPLLGKVAGSVDNARVELSDLGKAVEQCLSVFTERNPIEVVTYAIMPEHVHIVLNVKARLQWHIGRVIGWYKNACNREYHRFAGNASECRMEAGGCRMRASDSARLFTEDYFDRPLLRYDSLQELIVYVNDNPKRRLMRQIESPYFKIKRNVDVAGMRFDAVGNMELLKERRFVQVQMSRKDYLAETGEPTNETARRKMNDLILAARNGAVLVSPSISDGEKAVRDQALKEHLPIIDLQENGFPEKYHPGDLYFDPCYEGRVLILAPWEYHMEKRQITRQQCLALNEIASVICERMGQ